MALDPIQTAYEQIQVDNLIPSFFEWIFGGALGLSNGSMWGIAFLLVVAVSSLLIFKPYGLANAGITSSIITLVSSLLFLKAGWIGNGVFSLVIIYLGFTLYYLYSHKSETEA
jgi:hypothetical protein